VLCEAARECDGLVHVEDLTPTETASFLDHLKKPKLSDPRNSAHLPGTPIIRPISQGWSNARATAAGTTEEMEEADDEKRREEVLATYVSEMSGGSPFAVKGLFEELRRCKVLIPGKEGTFVVDPQFRDVAKIRKAASVPEHLASIAFSIFERFDLVEQTLLKAVSVFERNVGMRDFTAAMPKMQQDILESHIRRLASKKVRGLRRAEPESESNQLGRGKRVSLRNSVADQKEYFRFYSGLLLHAASSLLLESQKAQVRRNTQVLNMQDLSSILMQDRAFCEGIDEEDSSNSNLSSARGTPSPRQTPEPPPRSGTPCSIRGSLRKSVRLSQVQEDTS